MVIIGVHPASVFLQLLAMQALHESPPISFNGTYRGPRLVPYVSYDMLKLQTDKVQGGHNCRTALSSDCALCVVISIICIFCNQLVTCLSQLSRLCWSCHNCKLQSLLLCFHLYRIYRVKVLGSRHSRLNQAQRSYTCQRSKHLPTSSSTLREAYVR